MSLFELFFDRPETSRVSHLGSRHIARMCSLGLSMRSSPRKLSDSRTRPRRIASRSIATIPWQIPSTRMTTCLRKRTLRSLRRLLQQRQLLQHRRLAADSRKLERCNLPAPRSAHIPGEDCRQGRHRQPQVVLVVDEDKDEEEEQ